MAILATLNTNGLRNTDKRAELFNLLIRKKYDIIFLQETFWNETYYEIAKQEWKGEVISSIYTAGNRRGVSFLIKKDTDIEITDCYTDNDGRFVKLDIILDNHEVTIVNIYAPNIPSDRKH